MKSYSSTYLTDRLIAQCLKQKNKSGREQLMACEMPHLNLSVYWTHITHISRLYKVMHCLLDKLISLHLQRRQPRSSSLLSWAHTILSPIYSLPGLQVSALASSHALNLPCLSLAPSVPDASCTTACKWVHGLVSTMSLRKKKTTNNSHLPCLYLDLR